MLDCLVRDDPPQSKRALAIENQIREYVYFFVPNLIPILVEPGITKADETFAQNNQLYTDEIRRLFARFRAAENKLAAQAGRDADERTDLAVLVGAVAVGASMALIALFFGIVLARSIGRPVRAAADGADRIAGGDFYRLPEEGR